MNEPYEPDRNAVREAALTLQSLGIDPGWLDNWIRASAGFHQAVKEVYRVEKQGIRELEVALDTVRKRGIPVAPLGKEQLGLTDRSIDSRGSAGISFRAIFISSEVWSPSLTLLRQCPILAPTPQARWSKTRLMGG